MIGSILGKKIGMTQIFDDAGAMVGVTVIEAGPCHVLQVKTVEKDGYEALQVGFGDKREKNTTKPLIGVAAKAGVEPKRFIREIPTDGEEHKPGEAITVDAFSDAEFVDVIGTSKGKGFAGVVKKWHFRGQSATHGSIGHRVPGSIGQSSSPSRVLKGTKMATHMGSERVMVKRLKVVKVDPERNLLMVRGAVPGANGGFVIVRKCADRVAAGKSDKSGE